MLVLRDEAEHGSWEDAVCIVCDEARLSTGRFIPLDGRVVKVGGERGTLVECGRLGSAICDCGCQVYWMTNAPLVQLALEGCFYAEREDSRHIISRSLVDQRVWPRAVQKVLYCRPNQVTLRRAQGTVKTLAIDCDIIYQLPVFRYPIRHGIYTPTLPIIEWTVRVASDDAFVGEKAGGWAADGARARMPRKTSLLLASRLVWPGI